MRINFVNIVTKNIRNTVSDNFVTDDVSHLLCVVVQMRFITVVSSRPIPVSVYTNERNNDVHPP